MEGAPVAAFDYISPTAAGGDDGFGTNAPDRRTALGVDVGGLAQCPRTARAGRLPGASRPCPSLEAQDRHPCELSTAAYLAASADIQDLPVFAERPRDRAAESSLQPC